MKENYSSDNVRTRLILAGIRELEEHGANDFSLRRVAIAAQVSCAAPYRHFKDREELIDEILAYIDGEWKLFSKEVLAAYEGDVGRQIIELSVAHIRFWVANPNYRSLLCAEGMSAARTYDETLTRLLADLRGGGVDLSRAITALTFGTVICLWRGTLPNNDATFRAVRAEMKGILDR